MGWIGDFGKGLVLGLVLVLVLVTASTSTSTSKIVLLVGGITC